MSILPQKQEQKELFNAISSFFSKFQIGSLLRKCNAQKEKGVPTLDIFKYKLCNVFEDRSLYMQQKTNSFKETFSKNTYYRFLGSAKTNWMRFTTLISKKVVNSIEPLTDEKRINVFIVDDSLFERSSCKATELGSKVFDHCSMKFKKGFRLMTLGWSDGSTFLPINSCLLASSKKENILGTTKKFDARSLAGRRRKLAVTKGTDVMQKLIKTALDNGHCADYVLFDTWFSCPAQLLTIKKMKLDAIAMIKKTKKIFYTYEGQGLTINRIYGMCKKRRGRSKYLLSVNVVVGKGKNAFPAKIVCVRNRNNKKDWIPFICTNPDLSEEEIIRIYGKRWQIEVFFKTCKSRLNLISECHSLSYDALTAHVAIVFTRYLMIALEQRKCEDPRTLGEIFFYFVDELADITFGKALAIIMQVLIESVTTLLSLSEIQINALLKDFTSRLPKYMNDALSKASTGA